jgi:hypothetical protein
MALLCSCKDTRQPLQHTSQHRVCRSGRAFMKFFALKVRCNRSRFSLPSSSDHPSTCRGRRMRWHRLCCGNKPKELRSISSWRHQTPRHSARRFRRRSLASTRVNAPAAAARLPAPATAPRTAKRLGRYCFRMAHTASAQAPCLMRLVLPLLRLRSSPAAAPAAVLAAGQPSPALPAANRRGSVSELASSCRPTQWARALHVEWSRVVTWDTQGHARPGG